jgi:hypothetical protein
MSENRDDKLVDEHYGRSDLAAKILEALRAAGKDPDALTLEDLAPIDQLHARGAQAMRSASRASPAGAQPQRGPNLRGPGGPREAHNPMGLLRIVPGKTGFMAPGVLQARPHRPLMTTACSRGFSGPLCRQKQA